eukprot:SAG22_NODE_17729_length_299_cov_1.250000_1_plen_99_part_11
MLAPKSNIDAGAVARASQLMSSITAKPEQLSPNATDKALGYALSLAQAMDSGADAVVDIDSLATLADVTSNRVRAATDNELPADDSIEANRAKAALVVN